MWFPILRPFFSERQVAAFPGDPSCPGFSSSLVNFFFDAKLRWGRSCSLVRDCRRPWSWAEQELPPFPLQQRFSIVPNFASGPRSFSLLFFRLLPPFFWIKRDMRPRIPPPGPEGEFRPLHRRILSSIHPVIASSPSPFFTAFFPVMHTPSARAFPLYSSSSGDSSRWH